MALEQYLFRVASEEINFVVGDAILNGTGAGQPLGILNSSCLVTRGQGDRARRPPPSTRTNIVNMWARMWAPCRQNAVWLINQDVEPQLHTMTVGTGGRTLVAYCRPAGCRPSRTPR